MSGARRTFVACGVAVLPFLACVAVMMLLAQAEPPKAAPRPALGRETLETPREVQGVPCSGYVQLAPDGRIEYCFLVADERIDGIPCRHGSFWGEVTGGVIVRFHDNGRLAACRLVADVTLAGQTFAKGKRISLDPEGNVVPAAKDAK